MHKQDNIKDGRKTTSDDNPYIMNIIRMPKDGEQGTHKNK